MDLGNLHIAPDDDEFSRGVTAQQLQFKEKPKIGTGMSHAVRIERSFSTGSAFSFSVHPTTPHQHVEDDQSRDFHPAVIHVDRGVTLRLTRATLEANPGDYTSWGTLSLASDNNDDYLTLCDFHKPNEERVMTSLGIEVSGPRSIRLGINYWRGDLFGASINVFGSVVADRQSGATPDKKKNEVVTKKTESVALVVPGKSGTVPDETNKEVAQITVPPEKKVEATKNSKKRKLRVAATEDGAATKGEDEGEENLNEEEATSTVTSSSEPEKLTKKQRKKLAKKKAEELAEVVAKTEGHATEKTSRKNSEKKKTVPQTKERRLDGGVRVSDIIIGNGVAVRPGRKVAITYEGALTDGSVFDKNKSKKHPLEFRPGTGEVIKGLDRGLEGMKVGGERVITVPPALGYGKKGSGILIPGNSTLVFTVKLISVGGR